MGYTDTRVFEVLAQRGLTQKWLAERTGYSESAMSRMKERRSYSRRFAIIACKVLAEDEASLFFQEMMLDSDNMIGERESA